MTDREPDDLYDALRDRLADYGQEPPAPLWAGIRAQLPPPVAAPQRRRQYRHWRAVLLLSLLLAVGGAAGWQWWRMAGPSQRANRDLAIGSADNTLGDTDRMGKFTSPPASQISSLKTNSQPTASHSSPTKTPVNPGITNNKAADGRSAVEHLRVTAASPKQSEIDKAKPVVSATEGALAATAASLASRKRERASPLINRAGAAHHFPMTAHGKPARDAFYEAATQTRTAKHEATAARATVSRVAEVRPAGHLASKGTTAAILVSPPSATALVATASTSVTNSDSEKKEPESYLPANKPQAVSAKAIFTAAKTGAYTATETPEPAEDEALTTQPTLRLAALKMLTVAAPIVPATTDTVPPRPQPLVRRWAVLVLGGAALTHRRLGGAETLTAPLPTNTAPTAATADRQANEMAQQEHSGAGFGLQMQLRRVLNGRWSLSTGLGYQEYASQTAVSGAAAIRYSPAPTADYAHRDTYRFLTVPIRLGYALGPAVGRLHYGLLAGADAAFYLGGSTLTASGAVIDWDRTFSPYRALSVALSTGLDVRYRLAPRLELVAQPTATYFLTSVTKPALGQNARYLWGVGALLGVSFDLR